MVFRGEVPTEKQLVDILAVAEKNQENLIKKKYGLTLEMHEFKRTHGALFYKPFGYQVKFINYLQEGKKVVIMQGANQIGKTLTACNLVDSFANGKQAWNNQASIFKGQPTRGRIICADWEHHAKEVVVPKLKEVLEEGTYETRKNNVGVEAFWQFRNGSSFELMTHSQETKLHEGWTGNWVWADEPLPKDKYTANRRGLVALGGVFLCTMTAVYEPWILDEIVLSNKPHIGCVVEIPMKDNQTLSAVDIANFKADIPADQQVARVDGGWLQLVGKIVKGFDKDKHIIDDLKSIPSEWVITPVIDYHLSKPQAISFYAVNELNVHYVIDEIWENITPDQIGDMIVHKVRTNGWLCRNAYIDPLSKGDVKYMKNRGILAEDAFTIIRRKLLNAGIMLHVASKDKPSGIHNINTWLRGPNGIPILYFLRGKSEKHTHEIVRWVYDKDGKPMKEHDDFMECLYRYTLTGEKVYKNDNFYGKDEGAFSGASEKRGNNWMGN